MTKNHLFELVLKWIFLQQLYDYDYYITTSTLDISNQSCETYKHTHTLTKQDTQVCCVGECIYHYIPILNAQNIHTFTINISTLRILKTRCTSRQRRLKPRDSLGSTAVGHLKRSKKPQSWGVKYGQVSNFIVNSGRNYPRYHQIRRVFSHQQ